MRHTRTVPSPLEEATHWAGRATTWWTACEACGRGGGGKGWHKLCAFNMGANCVAAHSSQQGRAVQCPKGAGNRVMGTWLCSLSSWQHSQPSPSWHSRGRGDTRQAHGQLCGGARAVVGEGACRHTRRVRSSLLLTMVPSSGTQIAVTCPRGGEAGCHRAQRQRITERALGGHGGICDMMKRR